MTAATVIAFLTELFTLVPSLVTDVEQLIADFKATNATTPLAPAIEVDMAGLKAQLDASK